MRPAPGHRHLNRGQTQYLVVKTSLVAFQIDKPFFKFSQPLLGLSQASFQLFIIHGSDSVGSEGVQDRPVSTGDGPWQ